MPIEKSLFCSHRAITPSIQFGFKISLALLRGVCYLSTAWSTCADACICTHASTSRLSSWVRLEWSMVLLCIQGQIGTLSSLTESLQFFAVCSARRRRKCGICVWCWFFSSSEDKTITKYLWSNRIKDVYFIYYSFFSWVVLIRPCMVPDSLYGWVPPERLKN